ncbi:hypothetical protein G4B88_021676 [Cannabis sativa]|uniref:C3H1-type domain-containing protein n=1 Tax=Cannabis sativa TaxID=3483 RepID=A0A7J6GJ64_CANSA|nr:hypothetical protein G4B88_021676 [Cannabis sativa]
MELYGRSPARNGSNPGHQPEWTPDGGETGLEESMWQLGLTGAGDGGGESYPERPGVPNCVYYMRTGYCGYGNRCRYNHPRDRAASMGFILIDIEECTTYFVCNLISSNNVLINLVCFNMYLKVAAAVRATGEYPERVGEPICQCKFGLTCKFHHPQPAGTSVTASAPQFYPPVQSPSVPMPDQFGGPSTSLRVARPPLVPGSYVQGTYGPVLFPHGVVPLPGPVLSPGAQPTVGGASVYGVTHLPSSTASVARPYSSLPSSIGASSSSPKEQAFPERPGEPECQYYLKTGDCKFGSSCRYHHPRDRAVPRTNCLLSPVGLPLRPTDVKVDGYELDVGMQPCTFYLQNGHCKFGATCKFDHPLGTMRYSPSASSLIDMPVTPYPVGSLLATLAPSSTSSELRPELIPGSKMESFSARMPSSGNTSTSSVGLIFSQTGPVSLSDVQLSSQSSVALSSSRSTRQGGEVRRSS